jgi:Thiamine pyrophosphate enzyme, N-terminal TPP binding domain
MAKNIAQLMVDTLVQAGVERVYGLPGDSLNGFTDSIRKQKKPYLNGLRQSAWNALWLANNADSCLRQQKKRNSRQNFQSAASLILMSMPPKPPERLAEILQEILALSDSRATSQSESAGGSDPTKNSDAHGVEEQSQRRDEEDKNRRAP